MIHLNVAFLVIHPTFNTIVKILLNASPLVVNKYMSNGLFRACIATIWRLECTSVNVYYKSTFDGRDYMSEFLEFLKVSFVSCLYQLIL